MSGAKIELYPRGGMSIDHDDPDKAYYGTRPILNLIYTTRSLFASANMVEIQHRLSRESTVIVAQDGMGIIEQFHKNNLPDPRNRPTFRMAVANLSVEQGEEETAEVLLSSTLVSDRISGKVGYHAKLINNFIGAEAAISKIGPVAVNEGSESPELIQYRERASKYLVNLLIQNRLLSTLR